jgi:hypothetical protein
MLIITSLAAGVLSTSLAAAVANTTTLPPMVIAVRVAADISPSLVSRMLDETDAVWRTTGLTFIWRRVSSAPARPDQYPASAPTGLSVVIGDSRGTLRDDRVPLGWIQFEQGSPMQEIYVSYRNAVDYMADAQGVVGVMNRMPVAEREIKLARAMGRALAHELGHYLLASKAHTRAGLMQASHTASEFFEYARRGFAIDAAQRQLIAARLRQDAVVVRR